MSNRSHPADEFDRNVTHKTYLQQHEKIHLQIEAKDHNRTGLSVKTIFLPPTAAGDPESME